MPHKPYPTEIFRKFLQKVGCKQIGTNKHEKWMKEGLLRPVMFSPSKREIPSMVIKSNLRTLGLTWVEFEQIVKDL